jgi:predicted nucleic acid-binding protein
MLNLEENRERLIRNVLRAVKKEHVGILESEEVWYEPSEILEALLESQASVSTEKKPEECKHNSFKKRKMKKNKSRGFFSNFKEYQDKKDNNDN